jgi:hypothetical protein
MKKRYLLAAVVSVTIFAILNAIEPRGYPDDFVIPHGRPFHFWWEGGFIHSRGVLWGGLLADVLVILGAAIFFAYLIGVYERRK